MHSARINFLEDQLAKHGEDSFVRYALAKEYENIGDHTSALTHYTLLLSIDPEYVGLYYHLGHLYIELGDKEKAAEIFSSGIEMARKQNDRHALAELMNANSNLLLDI